MKSALKIKVCGMGEPENIAAVSALGPDYLGFIFYEGSSRFYRPSSSVPVKPEGIKHVGVFVNAELDRILEIKESLSLDVIQLHGTETPIFCEKLKASGVEVIKAFGVDQVFEFKTLDDYGCCDYFLFDTKADTYGGTGRAFDWQLLDGYLLSKPYFLSGGLSLENLSGLNDISDERFFAVDLNSRFEVAPALKNIGKLKEAFNILKNKERI